LLEVQLHILRPINSWPCPLLLTLLCDCLVKTLVCQLELRKGFDHWINRLFVYIGSPIDVPSDMSFLLVGLNQLLRLVDLLDTLFNFLQKHRIIDFPVQSNEVLCFEKTLRGSLVHLAIFVLDGKVVVRYPKSLVQGCPRLLGWIKHYRIKLGFRYVLLKHGLLPSDF